MYRSFFLESLLYFTHPVSASKDFDFDIPNTIFSYLCSLAPEILQVWSTLCLLNISQKASPPPLLDEKAINLLLYSLALQLSCKLLSAEHPCTVVHPCTVLQPCTVVKPCTAAQHCKVGQPCTCVQPCTVVHSCTVVQPCTVV